jgi:hypothetical protein
VKAVIVRATAPRTSLRAQINSALAGDRRPDEDFQGRLLALTSLSWLLPVELTPDAREIVRIHYDHAIEPAASYQEYGVEDARICRIDNVWYMTTCSVSAERHCTTLHVSLNGLDYELKGVVLDHQNKDMILFEGKVGGRFIALTRPLGEVYFAYPEASPYAGGPSINLAQSPDAIHWKPLDQPGIRVRKGSTSSMKVGGGSQPIRTNRGWFLLYHGVETRETVGVYPPSRHRSTLARPPAGLTSGTSLAGAHRPSGSGGGFPSPAPFLPGRVVLSGHNSTCRCDKARA